MTIPEMAPPLQSTPVIKGGKFAKIKPFLAPLLITAILAVGQSHFRILETNFGTAVAIITSILMEMVLSLYATGRWPHLASCYITGISVGILLHTPLLWPYILCTMLAISSKYALRIQGRHLWNPSNLGVSLLLFFIPAAVAPLSQQWGNEIWPSVIILLLGSLILLTLGRVHITLVYAAAFTIFAVARVGWTEDKMISQLALLTAPAYQLFMLFMITDPKTTTRTFGRQCAVAVLVALVEALLRMGKEIHAPYYALFIVAPVTNLLEIWWDGRGKTKTCPEGVTSSPAIPAETKANCEAGVEMNPSKLI